MQTKQLGDTGIEISVVGLGGMPMSLSKRPPESQAIETIHRALSLGITLIDTADAYCLNESEKHHNEKLIHQALQQYDGDTSRIFTVTKGGFTRPNGEWVVNGNPDYLRQSIQDSFEALGGDKPIDLWLYHSPDPKYSIKESLTPAKEALAKGIIRFVGVSNFSVNQIKQAREVVDIVAVENQYNLWHRNSEFNGVLEYCEQEKLTFLAWSPLGGFAGKRRTSDLDSIAILKELAAAKGVSTYCILLAWLRAKSPAIVPIIGARRPSSIEDSANSISVQLSDEEVQQMNNSVATLSVARRGMGWVKRQLESLLISS
ncbi:aldo/keto reductase [Halotia branconii]|uniref:Aldo/keto reductase n=1 Tax=Halotia branconii CENA392 TaxID=1539056 RepID=A0AAJ6NYF2_9CYAN|nr:aldo/keto reductase [Halotia branconii]WGV28763.1 aldo/keto reductase [Halotia branconii CENA392]